MVVLLISTGAVLAAGANAEVVIHVEAASNDLTGIAAASATSREDLAAKAPPSPDDPPGSQRKPFGTLQAALEHAVGLGNDEPVTILLRPGTYQESIKVQLRPDSPKLRIAAVEAGTAMISGAEPIVSWKRVGPGLYTAEWPEALALSTIPAEWPGWLNIGKPALHREMLFSDQHWLQQVYDFADMRPGTFMVDDPGRQVFVRAGPYVDPGRTVIETARRPRLFELSGATGLEIDGLVFSRAATPMMEAAVEITKSTDVSLRDVTVSNNNSTGLSINQSDRVSLTRVKIVDNGSTGAGIWQVRGLKIDDSEASRNNWRGETGKFTDWAVAGIKILQVRDAVIDKFRAIDNLGPGLWLDTDISGVEIAEADISGNQGAGLVLEATQGPVTIHGTRIARNGIGIVAAAAHDITLNNNTIACNRQEQVMMTGSQDLPVIDHLTNARTVVNNDGWTLAGNVISAAQQDSFLIGSTMPGEYWRRFLSSLSASNNRWSHSATDAPFLEPMGRKSDFARWQQIAGDRDSQFDDAPDTRCFAEASDR